MQMFIGLISTATDAHGGIWVNIAEYTEYTCSQFKGRWKRNGQWKIFTQLRRK